MKKVYPTNNDPFAEFDAYAQAHKPDWEKSKETIWDQTFSQLPYPETKRNNRVVFLRTLAAAAAVILVVVTWYLSFDTTQIVCKPGNHLSYTLPDGTLVKLNAGTRISYKTWFFEYRRTVNLQGEAYFKVVKGNTFKVMSDLGKTSVLGASFNIYARNGAYTVTCFSGKVQVDASKNADNITIEANQQVKLNTKGTLELNNSSSDVKNSTAWMSDNLVFTAQDIKLVMAEIMRQYNVTIQLDSLIEGSYTGNFSRNIPISEVLDLVCKPLNLNFMQTENKVFVISAK